MSASNSEPGDWLADGPAESDVQDLPELAQQLGIRYLRMVSPPRADVSVSELSALIYAQYQFPNGSKQLGGFSVRPQFVACLGIMDESTRTMRFQSAWSEKGHPIRKSSLSYLGLDDWLRQAWAGSSIDAKSDAKESPGSQAGGQPLPVDFLATVLQNCGHEVDAVLMTQIQYLEGKIEFHHDDQIMETRIGLWLPEFQANPSRIQPYFCPLTGQSGKQLTVDQEGDIGLLDSLKTCARSGRQLLSYKLACCSNTGNWAQRSLMVPTAIGGQWMVPDAISCCRKCGLPIAKTQWDRKGCCPGCRALHAVQKSGTRSIESCNGREHRAVLDEVAPGWETNQITIALYENLTWIQIEIPGQRAQLVVLDGTNQMIVHRNRLSRWRDRWGDA